MQHKFPHLSDRCPKDTASRRRSGDELTSLSHILSPISPLERALSPHFPHFSLCYQQNILLLPYPFTYRAQILSPYEDLPLLFGLMSIRYGFSVVAPISIHPCSHICSPKLPYLFTYQGAHLPYPFTLAPISFHLAPRNALILSHFSAPKHIKRCSSKHIKQQQDAWRVRLRVVAFFLLKIKTGD